MLQTLTFQWRLAEDVGEFGSITKSIQQPRLGVKWKAGCEGHARNEPLLSQGTVSQCIPSMVQEQTVQKLQGMGTSRKRTS